MKKFTKFSEFMKEYPGVLDLDVQIIKDVCKDSGTEFSDEISESWGGCIYVVETFLDLESILTSKYSKSLGQFLPITLAADTFDVFRKLNDSYSLIANINNNSGGDSYVIPNMFVKSYPNIAESERLTALSYKE
jgi:hypothetical protein